MSSGRASTGFGRVARGIGAALHDRYDIHLLGHDVWESVSVPGCTLHPGTRRDIFGLAQLPELHDALRPDAPRVLNDHWFVPAFQRALEAAQHCSKLVFYLPVDARVLDPHQLDPLRRLDAVVVYTEFGRQVVLGAMASTGGISGRLRSVVTIPHGIDTATFRPVPDDRAAARRALLGAAAPAGGFWVLNANKNSLRKRLDLTMIGFSLFARGKPADVKLYMHAGRRDTGPDLQRLSRNLGLADRLIVTDDTYYHPDVSPSRLNLIYNACDVGVNTCVGEGWGLVAFEHGATRSAQILPRHSALAELWPDAAVFLEPVGPVRFRDFLEGDMISPEHLAEALELLYSDREYLALMSLAAHRNAMRPEWSWKAAGAQWDGFFQSLLTC